MLKRLVKAVAQTILPVRLYTTIEAHRSRAHQIRFLKERGILADVQRFVDEHGLSVLSGPFTGLRYTQDAALSRNSIPMLSGQYESELHEVLQGLDLSQYESIIDIGCAEGYYAVGLARIGGRSVFAFDADPTELSHCRQIAAANDVSQKLTFGGWCDSAALASITSGRRCFVLSDCEGFEATLFSDATVPALSHSELLIELHGDVSEPILSRFGRTHHPTLINYTGAGPHRELRDRAQQWLFLKSIRN
jgi:hypothetical protein